MKATMCDVCGEAKQPDNAVVVRIAVMKIARNEDTFSLASVGPVQDVDICHQCLDRCGLVHPYPPDLSRQETVINLTVLKDMLGRVPFKEGVPTNE